jgi:hypothetical protein
LGLAEAWGIWWAVGLVLGWQWRLLLGLALELLWV